MRRSFGDGPAELAAVQRIVELRGDGGYSYRQIAAHLDRKGLAPRRAAAWSAAAVRLVWLRTQRS